MVDATLIATSVQTIAITLTLIVFILQFRSQEKALKESAYQNVMGRYNDFVMGEREIGAAMLGRVHPGANPSPEELLEFRRDAIAYGIIEEAYVLYKRNWIDKATWEQWQTWLVSICRHPYFPEFQRATQGMFDKDFEAHVSDMVANSKKA